MRGWDSGDRGTCRPNTLWTLWACSSSCSSSHGSPRLCSLLSTHFLAFTVTFPQTRNFSPYGRCLAFLQPLPARLTFSWVPLCQAVPTCQDFSLPHLSPALAVHLADFPVAETCPDDLPAALSLPIPPSPGTPAAK